MNWFDFIIIIVALAGLFTGVRVGLIGAVFYAAGVLVASLFAANLSDDIAGWFTNHGAADAIATVLAYAVIFTGVFICAMAAHRLAKVVIRLPLLGWVGTLGAIVAGLLLGIGLTSVLILGAARLSSDIPAGDTIDSVIETTELRGSLQKALVLSRLTGVFINVTDWLPGNALGFVPGDYKIALEQIDKLAEQEAAQ